jgi:hypothetical protein
MEYIGEGVSVNFCDNQCIIVQKAYWLNYLILLTGYPSLLFGFYYFEYYNYFTTVLLATVLFFSIKYVTRRTIINLNFSKKITYSSLVHI